jgi:cystathionine beta-synthase
MTDKDGMLMTRRLAREEGIFVGNSAGSAIAGLRQLKHELGPDDLVVVIFHDHGSRYLGKIFNDDWMADRGFLTKEKPRAIDLIQAHKDRKLITLSPDEKLSSAIEKMNQFDISQMPVGQCGRICRITGRQDHFQIVATKSTEQTQTGFRDHGTSLSASKCEQYFRRHQ